LRRFRPRLTYANVVSTLCLFILLGGTAWAVAANSVGTAQLKNGAVTKPKVANDAVTSAKVDNGSIAKPDLSPAVTKALKDRCPSNMNQVGSVVCIEKIAHAPTDWESAATVCADKKLRLPSVGELFAVALAGYAADRGDYWTDQTHDAGAQQYAEVVSVQKRFLNPGFKAFASSQDVSENLYSACVTIPSGG
jgi:hypothetical protein